MKDDIFNFFYPFNNDYISLLNGNDLNFFLSLLEEFYLSLRPRINCNKDISFGLEIELGIAKIDELINKINDKSNKLDGWNSLGDASVPLGLEITSPILRDKNKTWEQVERVCLLARNYGSINENCGGHIHIGADIFQNITSFINFITMWACYENIIYRFLYGEYLGARRTITKYAPPIAVELRKCQNEIIKNNILDLDSIKKILPKDKYGAINFKNIKNISSSDFKNTIEFRSPNGSNNEVIWQNNVSFLIHLIEYSKSKKFDYEKILDKLNNNANILNNLTLYNQIFLSDALELADMIMDNNLDKMYFLRQYLKSFNSYSSFDKAKCFTR